MEEWKDVIGKQLKVIFEDGREHVSKKEGKLISTTQTHILLLINEKIEGIRKTDIKRFEEMI